VLKTNNHSDLLGQEIAIGDHVVSYDGHTLGIFVVEKMNPKMVKVRKLTYKSTCLRYPRDLMVIDRDKAIFKVLQL
jgi:hypothetical protein